MTQDEKAIRILYTNYRGETGLRTIVPERIYFGSTDWRDKRIRRLHELLAEKRVDDRIQRDIEEIAGPIEPEIIERLERMIARLRVDELQSTDIVLERFSEKEDRRRSRRQWLINLSRASFTVGITGSLWVANKPPPIQWWHYAVWTGALLLLGLSAYAFRTEVGDHLGRRELRTRQKKT